MKLAESHGSASPERRLVETLLVVLTIAVVSVVLVRSVVVPQALLDFYYLPVAWAAWRLGLRRGAGAAVLSAAIVIILAFRDPGLFGHLDEESWMRWVNIGVWGGFLFLTAYGVGLLAARDEARIRQLRAAYRGVLEIMSKFIDSIDRSTENHSRRVAGRAVEVGREMRLSEDDIETLRVAAFLHDIGKVDVSTDVLHKASQLDPNERAEMAKHVDYGTILLQRVGGLLEHVIPIVMYHHERWDGAGYKGLSGKDIPLGARIIAVCDTYDAIVADRPYRVGRSHGEALAILRAESGTQFDPEIVEVFLRLYDVESVAAESVERAA